MPRKSIILDLAVLALACFTIRAMLDILRRRNYHFCVAVLGVWTVLWLGSGLWSVIGALSAVDVEAAVMQIGITVLVGVPIYFTAILLRDHSVRMEFAAREQRGCCPHCGFDVRFVQGSRCTDCGNPIPPEVFQHHARRKFDDRQRAINAAIEEPGERPQGE